MITEIPQETLERIADRVVWFLRPRLIFTQRLRRTYDPERLIELDDFRAQYQAFRKEIRSINDCGDLHRRSLLRQKHQLERDHVDAVLISEERIDELLSLIRQSVVQYGLGDTESSGRDMYFVQSALSRMKAEELSEKDRQALEYWRDVPKDVLMNKGIAGSIALGYHDHIISASSHEWLKGRIFEFDENGKENVYIENLAEEDFLIAADLFFGWSIQPDGGKMPGVFLKKQNTGGLTMSEEEFVYKEVAVLGTFCEKRCLCDLAGFNESLAQTELACMLKPFYGEVREILEIVGAYNYLLEVNTAAFTPIIDAAVNWWAKVIVNPKFDAGEDMAAINKLATDLSTPDSTLANPASTRMDVFKKALGRKIKSRLIAYHGRCDLSIDYNPCCILAEAAAEAGLDTMNFPWKTFMSIDPKSIRARCGQSSPDETIWEAEA
jgi:hypothetical protein